MPATLPGSVIQFGEYQLDCGRFELLRNGRFLRVERKPMELLVLLASREGEIVTRDEIAQRLWSPDVFVDIEHGINTAIGKLRHVLRDDPIHPRFIQTVMGMGYRFIAPVSAAAPVLPTENTAEPVLTAAPPSRRSAPGWYVGAGVCMVLLFVGIALHRSPQRQAEIRYTQLTDFTDSAVAPALSPDGHMVAFIRGSNGFFTSDQIYVKMLPDGEARRVTEDNRPKYGLAFSPDGSEIAYTVMENAGFTTYEVSALGGEPRLLMKNAAGLVWLDPQQVLFSMIRPGEGVHLGVVTATMTRSGLREIYFPTHERGMAHYSFPSPDRRSALVVEMNGNGEWAPCRWIALKGQSPSRVVGPAGSCMSAGWSPDGSWMYFTAWVGGQSHIWRQHFPEGKPEQITFGPAEESGIAMEPEGRALITSVGVHESSIWIHDQHGERPLSSEGKVFAWPRPIFSPDASVLYYLLGRGKGSGAELWRTVVASGKSEPVFSGISMTAFDLSPDGKRVVYTTVASDGTTQMWLAPLDRTSSAVKLNGSGGRSPHFAARNQIMFLQTEGEANYLERIDLDGSHRSRALPYPVEELQNVSPNQRWAMIAVAKTPDENAPGIVAVSLDGGIVRRICASYCTPAWSTDGRFLIVPVEAPTRTSPGRSLAIPVGPGGNLPELPVGGIAPLAEPTVVHGAESIGRAELVPGRDPKKYAWVNTTVHHNLYRISLP